MSTHHGSTHDRGGGRRCTRRGEVVEDWNLVDCPDCLTIQAEREAARRAWNLFMGRGAG